MMATLDEIKKLFESSDANVEKGFKNLRGEMKDLREDMKQTIAESMQVTNERVEILEAKLKEKDEQITSLHKDFEYYKKRNNLVMFGVPENEQNVEELETNVFNLVKKATCIEINENDIDDIFRIGKKGDQCRPVLISLISYRKKQVILNKKSLFRKENITVQADLPKSVTEEKKRLQPMVTALNKSGVKASLRLNELYISGKKLSKNEVEVEMEKFQQKSKRLRSPSETATSNKRIQAAKLNINTTVHTPRKLKQGTSTETQNSFSLTPITHVQTMSTSSRVFPVFNQPPNERNGVLSPLPGGSDHSKVFEYRSAK